MARSKSARVRTETTEGADVAEASESARSPQRVLSSFAVALFLIGAFFAWQCRAYLSSSVPVPAESATTSAEIARAAASTDSAPPRHVEPVVEPPTIVAEGVDREVVAAIARDRATVIGNPQSGLAWGYLGMTLYAHEFNQAAVTCLAQAAQLAPDDARWPYLHGWVLRAGNPQESVERLQAAVRISGNEPAAVRLTLCEVLLESYRLDEAEHQLQAFQVDARNDPRAKLAEARLTFMRGNYTSCLEMLRQLREEMNSQPRYRGRGQSMLLLMAEALRREGQVEQAELTRRQAMNEAEPIWDDGIVAQVIQRKVGLKKYLNTADRMYARQEYDKSLELLQATVAKYPESTWAKILLARVLIRTGAPDSPRSDRKLRLDQAVATLQEALAAEPNSVEAIFRMAVAKEYQGKFDESVALYRRAVELKPDFAMAYYSLAGILWNQRGDAEGANAAFEGAIRSQPDFVDGHYLYGVVLMRQGRYADAIPRFETVVRLQPDRKQFQDALAVARRRLASSE